MPLAKCPKCGEFVSPRLNFCPQCGAAIPHDNNAATDDSDDTATRLISDDDTATRLINRDDKTVLVSTPPTDNATTPDNHDEQPRRRRTWIPIVIVLVILAIGGIVTLAILGNDDTSLAPTNADTALIGDTTPANDDAEAVVTTETQTPDMAMFDVLGPVSSLTIPDGNYPGTISFDQNGNIDGIDYYNNAFKRDENGYITTLTLENNDGTIEYRYKWSKGRVTQLTILIDNIETLSEEYEYDQNGRVSTTTVHHLSGEIAYTLYAYEYLDQDQHGNWTKRSVASTDLDENGDEIQSAGPSVEERHITY